MTSCCVFTGAAARTRPERSSKGEGKGQLDLPVARQGGFAGGLLAIFVPSANGATDPNGEAPSQNVSSGALLPPAVELMLFAMVSPLLSNEFSRNVVA